MGTLKVCSVAFYLKKIMDDSTYENIKASTIKNITTPNILFFFKVVLDFLRIIELMLSVRHNFSSPEKSPHHRIFEIYIVVFCLFGFVCCCYFFFFLMSDEVRLIIAHLKIWGLLIFYDVIDKSIVVRTWRLLHQLTWAVATHSKHPCHTNCASPQHSLFS